MTDLNTTKHKHLTQDDRLEIQDCLNHGMTFKAISKRIDKDQTTISKEVKKHISVNPSSVKRTNQSGNPIKIEICASLLKAPFVCNPCKRRHAYCGFQKQLYNAKVAENEYKTLLVESRVGIPLNKDEFYEIDNIVSNGIKRGQHLYHIMQTNNLGISKSTIYRHLKRGYLSVSPIDFPRVVKFKLRNQRRLGYVPKATRIGRTYDDFLTYTEVNNRPVPKLKHGGKTILTFDFTFCNFMVGYLLDNKTSLSVTEKIHLLKIKFRDENLHFGDIFPLILTDNGGEFANVSTIENGLTGEKETSVFFCDPYKSCQKPRIEKNHTLFRDIVPKGESFDNFTQLDVNKIFSHINSVKRKSLNGKTPFEIFTFTYNSEIAAIFEIESIPPKDVIQSPKLLK